MFRRRAGVSHRKEPDAREHFRLQLDRRVVNRDLHLNRVLLDVGFVDDAGDLAVERAVGEDADDDFRFLPHADLRRVGEGDVDTDL